MKTPKDFDYDIWKDDDGHYYIRVKCTGETTRVSKEVVRELWRELYRMDKYRKDTTITDEDGSRHTRILSLDENSAASEKGHSAPSETWLISRENAYDDIEFELLEQDFLKTLTAKQRRLYHLRFKMRLSILQCADQIGTTESNAEQMLLRIKKKAKLFF